MQFSISIVAVLSALAVANVSAVALGGHCGGFIIPAPVCNSGLTCKLGSVPDAGGICVPIAEYGAACGGNLSFAPVCDSGLVCTLSSPIGGDVGGKCLVALNGHCGGNIQPSRQCGTGLTCKLGRIPDAGGVCVASS